MVSLRLMFNRRSSRSCVAVGLVSVVLCLSVLLYVKNERMQELLNNVQSRLETSEREEFMESLHNAKMNVVTDTPVSRLNWSHCMTGMSRTNVHITGGIPFANGPTKTSRTWILTLVASITSVNSIP